LSAHLIDNAADWAALGTDLLDGAPDWLRGELTGGRHDPSRQLAGPITADGSPPGRMAVTEQSVSGLDWGYVLHPHGIEVINLHHDKHGPLVDWSTDARTRFSDNYARWKPTGPVPTPLLPRTAPPAPPPPLGRPAPHGLLLAADNVRHPCAHPGGDDRHRHPTEGRTGPA
jgi:hypothetical protein